MLLKSSILISLKAHSLWFYVVKAKSSMLLKSSIRLVVLLGKTKEQYAPFGCA
jgi:hypothetical protein